MSRFFSKQLLIGGLLLVAGFPHCDGQVSDSLAKKIDRVFSEWDNTSSPGCALAVLKDGKVIYTRGYGMSNMEYAIAITPGSIFHVASISKQFTAAAIIRLAMEGKLSVNDDVRKYIPEVPDLGHPISLANLMHHSSGLRDQWDLVTLAGWREGDDITEDDIMEMVKRQQDLNFRPGDEYLYCNTGFTLLGIVVKRVTGVSLRHYADSCFFKPLGMNSTHFHSDHTEIVPNRTSAYVRDGDRWAINIPVFDNYGATSLFTTVGDLAKWDENFYTAKVGGPAFIDAMLKPGVLNNGELQTYASGLMLGQYKGRNFVEHSGADAGYRANFLRFPEQHFSVIILANLGNINPTELCRKVTDLMLPPGKGEVTPVVIVDTATIGRWAGDYYDYTSKVRMKLEGNAVNFGNSGWLSLNGNGLRALNDTVFMHPFNGAEYRFHGSGDKVMVLLRAPGMKDRSYEKVKKVAVSLAGLEDFVGTYYSKELDVRYTFFISDNILQVKTPRNDAAELRPFIKDVFLGPFLLEFQRDKKGKVGGFLLNTGRSRNLRFEKI
ncbi:serine hydrolase domain-containing protein [Puia sp.]|jgi:CubicO group peptidase (beta-lactamase class C family)|uniref:serine hydrolase domain-containing protein n=1 Tax=Puia sp. TaxID=2045100 RepID=UPI002F4188AA